MTDTTDAIERAKALLGAVERAELVTGDNHDEDATSDSCRACRDIEVRDRLSAPDALRVLIVQAEALKLRQSYMCCYPPELCERCLADREALAEIEKLFP